MRLVVLAFGGAIAERALTHLALDNVTADALILSQSPHGPRATRQARPVARAAVPVVRRVAISLLTRVLGRLRPSPPSEADPLGRWRGLAVDVHQVATLHDSVTTELLSALAPDYILLAGTGIVGDNVLRSARVGVLNVHPALLPWVRGMGGLEASVLRGVPPGVTAHFVDAGIDTGPIVHRQLVPVTSHDTLESLRKKAELLCAQVTSELFRDAARGRVLRGTPQQAHFGYAAYPTAVDRTEAATLIAQGKVRDTYDQWRAAVGGHVLPDRDDLLPAPRTL